MEEYKKILKANGITGRDMAGMLGLSESSYWSMLSRGIKRGTPRWVRAFMVGYELRDKMERSQQKNVESDFQVKEAAEFRESLGLTYQKLVTIYLETGETSGISVDDLMQAYADKVIKTLVKKEMDRLWEIIPDAHKNNPTDKELIDLGKYLALEELEEQLKTK